MFLRQKVIQKMIILQKLGIMITVNYDYYQKTSQKNAQIKKRFRPWFQDCYIFYEYASSEITIG